MRGRDFERWAKRYLVPEMPGFIADRRYLIRAPIEWQVVGFVLSGSAWGTGSYLHAVSTLLNSPHHGVHLSYGTRVGGPNESYLIDPADPEPGMRQMKEQIVGHGLPFLSDRESLAGNARFYRDLWYQKLKEPEPPFSVWQRTGRPDRMLSVSLARDLGFTMILTAEFEEAARWLTYLREQRPFYPHDQLTDWVVEEYDRLAKLEDLLDRSPLLAIERLKEWRRACLEKEKLEKWALPDGELPVPE